MHGRIRGVFARLGLALTEEVDRRMAAVLQYLADARQRGPRTRKAIAPAVPVVDDPGP
ncbi:hypothetical protein [Streptomyces sp. YKOK-I1]